MSNIIAGKGYEISTDMDEIDWEDSQELANEILIAAKEKGKVLMWVSAGNIDWRGNSGYGVFDVDDNEYEKFWQQISGTNGDWTLRTVTPVREGKDFGCIVSSHDVPTGGLRKVKFMTAAEAYRRLRQEVGIPRKEIIEHFDTYTYRADEDGRITNEMIYEAIAYADADWYQELVESQA